MTTKCFCSRFIIPSFNVSISDCRENKLDKTYCSSKKVKNKSCNFSCMFRTYLITAYRSWFDFIFTFSLLFIVLLDFFPEARNSTPNVTNRKLTWIRYIFKSIYTLVIHRLHTFVSEKHYLCGTICIEFILSAFTTCQPTKFT